MTYLGDNMSSLDSFEVKILRELVRNPRISDNKISRITKIPVKTVNRKRKILEERGFINYLTLLDYVKMGIFGTTQLYLVIMREGVTKQALSNFLGSINYSSHLVKHIDSCFIGEFEGNSALVFVIQSRKDEDVVEIFNADLVPMINSKFGQGSVKDVKVLRINELFSISHNYLLSKNMEQGKIRSDWPNDMLFISD